MTPQPNVDAILGRLKGIRGSSWASGGMAVGGLGLWASSRDPFTGAIGGGLAAGGATLLGLRNRPILKIAASLGTMPLGALAGSMIGRSYPGSYQGRSRSIHSINQQGIPQSLGSVARAPISALGSRVL